MARNIVAGDLLAHAVTFGNLMNLNFLVGNLLTLILFRVNMLQKNRDFLT